MKKRYDYDIIQNNKYSLGSFKVIIKYMLIYLIFINLLGVTLSCYDKNQATIRGKRIRESTLMLLGFFGGATGMYFIMKSIRHKTRKKKFMVGLPIFIILHLALAVLYLYYLKK